MNHSADGSIKPTKIEKPASIPRKVWDSLPIYVKIFIYTLGITGVATLAGKLNPLSEEEIISMTGEETIQTSASHGLQVRNSLGPEFTISGTPQEGMRLKAEAGVLAFKDWYESSLIHYKTEDGILKTINAEVPIKKDFSLSKNGQRLAYYSVNQFNNEETIKVINTKNDSPEATIDGGHPIFSPDSEKLAFTRYNPETNKTSLFTYENNEIQPMGQIEGELLGWDWHDEDHIIISSLNERGNILTQRSLTTLGYRELYRETNPNNQIRDLSVSPDSKYVAFTSGPTDMSTPGSSFKVLDITTPSKKWTVVNDELVLGFDWGKNGHLFYNIPNGDNSGLFGYNPETKKIDRINTSLPDRSLAVIDH